MLTYETSEVDLHIYFSKANKTNSVQKLMMPHHKEMLVTPYKWKGLPYVSF